MSQLKQKPSKEELPKKASSTGIEYPHPYDCLFPISGFQLWAGNLQLQNLVETQRNEFLQADKAQQAAIVLKIVHSIKRNSGRFLQSDVEYKDQPVVVVWKTLEEVDILRNIGQLFRRKKKLSKNKPRRPLPVVDPTEPPLCCPSTLAPLQSLFYLPPSANGQQLPTREDSSSSEDEPEPIIKPVKIKPPKVPKSAPHPSQTLSSNTAADAIKPPPTKKPRKSPSSLSSRGRPKKSQIAALQQEGETNLPKGVTVRPSGKWQAQTYFAGQSRYVGVYDTSTLAAMAYNTVQDFLAEYRGIRGITKTSPKEELTDVFTKARRKAEDVVAHYLLEQKKHEGKHTRGKVVSSSSPTGSSDSPTASSPAAALTE